jgi:hypothetical protein
LKVSPTLPRSGLGSTRKHETPESSDDGPYRY